MITVYFATNRDESTVPGQHFGERFHKDGPMFYRVGSAELERVSNDVDEGYTVRKVTVFPEIPEDDSGRELLGSEKLFAELRQKIAADPRDVIVLIHGFGNSFEESLKRAAQVKEAYLIERQDGTVEEPYLVVFSWPSNGRISPPWEYHSDRDDAQASGVAMARFMMRLLDFLSDEEGKCRQHIHLVAHSMGNWALRHGVLGVRNQVGEGNLPGIFDNAFLMAADEDEDTLEHAHKMGLLTQLARSVHVYHNRGDGALVISDSTKFNPDRLGAAGPRTFSGLNIRITAVDCSEVDVTEAAHLCHQYYRIRPEVIKDVRAVLSGRYRPDQVPGREVVEPGRRYRIVGPRQLGLPAAPPRPSRVRRSRSRAPSP